MLPRPLQIPFEPTVQNDGVTSSVSKLPKLLLYRNPVLSEVVEAASNLRVWSRSNYFGSLYYVYRSVFSFSPAGPVPA